MCVRAPTPPCTFSAPPSANLELQRSSSQTSSKHHQATPYYQAAASRALNISRTSHTVSSNLQRTSSTHNPIVLHNRPPKRIATMSSADTTPISPARFASALKSLSVEMLHLKVLEIRNSIAHLQYSNDQLKPFAEPSPDSATEPDADCVEAIKENEGVIDRMAERIALIRLEVEERGVSWTEFQSKDEVDAQRTEGGETNGETGANGTGQQSDPWTDGTFQTGTIRNGEITMDETPRRPGGAQGGSLNDEELRRAMEERMRNLGTDDDDANGGMHL